MNKVQTDNSFFEAKIQLRMQLVESIQSNCINVLDLFGVEGRIWNEIKKRSGKEFNVLRIDIKSDRKGVYLKGNNIKYLRSLDISGFDIVDCDAYGIPYHQLKEIFKKNYKGLLFITYIQSVFGKLPVSMLNELGYSKQMVKKIPTLFNNNGLEKLKSWLSIYGITKINRVSYSRKHYLSINMRLQ